MPSPSSGRSQAAFTSLARDGLSVMEIEMPKENIDDCGSTLIRAEVSWHPDREGVGTGYVQVATVRSEEPDSAFDGDHKVSFVRNEQGKAALGGATLRGECTCGATWIATEATECIAARTWLDGWHVTLNREQINRMIRVLRRARDSAFGADA